MSRSKLLLIAVLVALVAAFFALDLGRFLSLEQLKQGQADFAALYAKRPALVIGGYFVAYVAVAALSLPDTYYVQLVADYQAKRDLMMEILGRHGFSGAAPAGAYYVMTDVSRFGYASDVEFAQYLVKEIGVATVPGSSFYLDPASAPQSLRFCFSKRADTLHEADRRLARLSATAASR